MDATLKALVWAGAIVLGGLYLCSLVAIGVATVVEKFDPPSSWRLPLTVLCGLATALPVYYASHAYSQSRSLSVYAAIAVGFATFAFARVFVPTRLREPKLGGFKPFWVRIVPNWHQLLTDYRGHSAEGGAETIQDKPHETCHPAFGRDSSEIAFTVLSPMLYYSESLQRFFTEFHVCERFKPTDNSEGAPTSPERPFVFHAKAAGMLKFYLEAPELSGDFDKLIVIASLPRELFAYYYGMNLSKKTRRWLGKELEGEGWKHGYPDSPGDWLDSDWLDSHPDWPRTYALKHKYLTLYYGDISHIGGSR